MTKEWYCLEICRDDDLPILSRYTKELRVFLDRSSKEQRLSIRLAKNGNILSNSLPPKSDEDYIVKKVAKEEFYKSYFLFLNELHKHDSSVGQFFWSKYKNEYTGAAWFAIEDGMKKNIRIQYSNEPKEFYISITCILNWQGIQHFRRSGNFIETAVFNRLFKSLLDFLHDSNEYHNRFRNLLQLLNPGALSETSDFEPLIQENLNYNGAVDRIKARLKTLERRLLEIDTDPTEDRIKMRGEIEGLLFSLSCFS